MVNNPPLFAQLLSNITLKHYMHNYVQLYKNESILPNAYSLGVVHL